MERPRARGQPSPLEAGQRLDEALAQLQLEPDAHQRRQLLAHLALLAKWNAVYNLTALRDPDQMLTQHLFDCLAVLPVLRDPVRAGRDHLADGAVVLDVGSGGGLPGVVLAICAPGVQVHCVDAVAKKAAFVRQVRAELGLANLFAHHARVETLRVRSAGAAGALPAGVQLLAAITLGVPQLDARRHLLLLGGRHA